MDNLINTLGFLLTLLLAVCSRLFGYPKDNNGETPDTPERS